MKSLHKAVSTIGSFLSKPSNIYAEPEMPVVQQVVAPVVEMKMPEPQPAPKVELELDMEMQMVVKEEPLQLLRNQRSRHRSRMII
jgi:hypothetical protein